MQGHSSNQLGKYQLVAEMARGGMGIVYLAVAQGPARFSKLLVIKELRPELVEDASFLEMFLEEARLAARLSHRNIVQTYEISAVGPRPYIVMDYLDGVPLARVLRRKSSKFSTAMHLRIICEMLQGLHYAHTLTDFDGTPLGIVHRDISPQNVFITFDGTAKLVDFGIAKSLDSSIETRTGVLKGKPAYMAPEQIAGEIDARADIFSAGVMIWEAAANQRMWGKRGDVEVLASVLKGLYPRLRDVVPDVPDELARICDRSLAKDPDLRYATASDLQSDLENYLGGAGPMREVGDVVSEIFSHERAVTRATIDAQVARMTSSPADKLPSLHPQSGETSAPSGASGPIYTAAPSSGPSAISGATPGGAAIHAPSVAPQGGQPANSGRRWLFGFGVLALVGVAFGVGAKMRVREHEAAPVAATPSPSPSPSPEAAASVAIAIRDPEPKNEAKTVQYKPEQDAPKATAAAPPKAWAPPAAPPRPPSPPARVNGGGASSGVDARDPRVPEPASEEKRMGYLTIDTYPWTRVTTAGRVLGDTPLVRVSLPAGTHVLTLENASENVRQTTVVQIKPGETVSRRLAF